MADHLHDEERETKKIKTDKQEIDNTYIHQILEFVQDENGSTFGFDIDINSIPDLNQIKEDLLLGKKEYDLIQTDLNNTKDAFLNLEIRFAGEWKRSTTNALNLGNEINNIALRVNRLNSVYADAFGLASNMLKELKSILNESDSNKNWENVDLDNKIELLAFVKNGLIVCTKLLGFCNDQKQTLWHFLNEIKNSLDNQEFEEIFENWNRLRSERTEELRQIALKIDKLMGKKVVMALFEDKYCECRKEFNKYSNDWYFIDWKKRAYSLDSDHVSKLFEEKKIEVNYHVIICFNFIILFNQNSNIRNN